MADMRLEEYSADAICRAMNLPGFIEPSWAQSDEPTLRIVLTPSWHPELCLTISRKNNTVLLSAIVLIEQLWSNNSKVRLPFCGEEISIPAQAFDELIGLFRMAYKTEPGRSVSIDGMGSESCLVSRTETQRFEMHTYAKPMNELAARVLELSWEKCQNPKVRNGLAHAARYLGIKYPLQELPPEPTVTRIAVLGTPEARQDYFEMMQRVKKRDSD